MGSFGPPTSAMLYLEAYTSEKVAFIAGPEFGSWQGTLHVIKALYG
jgi:hypothetical protein